MDTPNTQILGSELLMLPGVDEPRVAVPPLIDKAKSATSKSPEPPFVLYTSSAKVTVSSEFAAFKLTLLIVGTLVSTINALLAPKELVAPGLAKVKVAAFNAASLIVPLFNAKELVPA